jgi:uncharacterized protein YjbI with pentapeptide repeats
MPAITREEVLRKYAQGQGSFERADCREIVLKGAALDKINFRRADLNGANLEGSKLAGANFSSASLCEAYVARAGLQSANLQKADLEGANLEGANLQDADLSRANLEGASFEKASMARARLGYAQLDTTNLGGASLEGASFTNAELRESYLGGTDLRKASFEAATLDKVNLEESNLNEANLKEATIKNCNIERARLQQANLEGATITGTTLAGADLSGADLRFAELRTSILTGAKLTGAKLFGIEVDAEQFKDVVAEWIDFSAAGDGSQRINLQQLLQHLKGGAKGALLAPPSDATARRIFGKGDVLRGATLEFGPASVVEVEGRFENCTIRLGQGALFRIGVEGTLHHCRISGDGELSVHGSFVESPDGPGIVGCKRIVVGASGSITSTVEQPASLTHFGFEKGCHLKMKIVRGK